MPSIVCKAAIQGQKWLDYLEKKGRKINPYTLLILGKQIQFSRGSESNTDIFFQIGDFPGPSDAHDKWFEFAEQISRIYSLTMQVPPLISKPEIYDPITGSFMLNKDITLGTGTVYNPDAESVDIVEKYWSIVEKNERLINALHYYINSLSLRNFKLVILDLCKVIETLLGFPKNNQLGDALQSLGIDHLFCEIKKIKCLRNSKDSAHAAETSPKETKINSLDIRDSKNAARILINSVIEFIANGNDLATIYYPWKDYEPCNRCNCSDCPFCLYHACKTEHRTTLETAPLGYITLAGPRLLDFCGNGADRSSGKNCASTAGSRIVLKIC